MMGGNSKFYPALGRLVMLRGLVCFFHFGGTGNHQGKSIIMGGLPTPCETMGGVCLARLGRRWWWFAHCLSLGGGGQLSDCWGVTILGSGKNGGGGLDPSAHHALHTDT